MSRFLGKNAAALEPYTPGEQPRGQTFIKLNTNECPYPPSPMVEKALAEFESKNFRLYPDPEATVLRQNLGSHFGFTPDCVFVGNGSDEVIAFAFMAFFDRGDKVCFPDPSYGFYPVYADLYGLDARPVPLREDFSIGINDYNKLDGHTIIANPNAPTGIAMAREQIEKILQNNPDKLIMVDEAYVDFAEEVTCVPLIDQYENLLVIGTFSKSRSLAGMRLGYALGNRELIAALERIKYSFNPYNINTATQIAAGAATMDNAYLIKITGMVKTTRDRTALALREMGFTVLPSSTNFLFASHPGKSGKELYTYLRERRILVRHFSHPRTLEFARISIGTDQEMDLMIKALQEGFR